MSGNDEPFTRKFQLAAVDDSPRTEHRDQLRKQVLAVFDSTQAATSRPTSFKYQPINWRSIMKHTVSRIAAVVFICVLAGISVRFVFRGDTNVALADLLEPILTAKSARFKMTAQYEDKEPQTFVAMVLEPNRIRQELPDGKVSIWDFKKGKMVWLNTNEKKAMVINVTDLPKDEMSPNFFEHFRKQILEDQSDPNVKREALGEKEIDGRKAIGYRISGPLQITTIWGDPKTGLPFRVESTTKLLPDVKTTMTDFQFNVELDESLFSVEPPADYTVQSMQMPGSPAEEKDLVESFRRYSDLADGAFPDAFDFQAIIGVLKKLGFSKNKQPNDEQTNELMQLSAKLTRGLQFAFELPPEADAHYAGRGRKRGAADTPVFWYKVEGKKKYRIIYADLSVAEANSPPTVANAQPLHAKSANPVPPK